MPWPKKSLRDWRFRHGKFTGPSSSDRDGQIKLSRGGREKRVAKATPLNAWIWARISVQPLSVVEFELTRAEMGWSDLLLIAWASHRGNFELTLEIFYGP